MNGEEKKRMKSVVCAGMAILAMAGCARANLVDSNTIVQDGIEYYIQTNKSVYDLGENVEMLFRVTNLRNEKWSVRGLAPIGDIVVAEKEGGNFREVWNWSWYQIWPAGPLYLELQPNESAEISDIWTQIDYKGTWETQDDTQVLQGTYRISGVFDGIEGFSDPILIDTNVGVDITIIPEPAMIYYVDADAPGVNDGSSWTDAYNYLQDALTVSSSGDEIWVAQGIYRPDQGIGITPGDLRTTFQLMSGVTIKGGYAGFGEPDPNARDIKLYESILSGDLAGNDVDVNNPADLLYEPTRDENSFHVVTGSGTDPTAVLDGFTITGGNTNRDRMHGFGAGMFNVGGSPTVTNCTFTRNSAVGDGGGMLNNHGNPRLTSCIFSTNTGYYGGGICSYSGDIILANCKFINNSALHYGGGIYGVGTLVNCTFSGNRARYGSAISGGGTLTNCILWDGSDEVYSRDRSMIAITYSDVQGGWPGEGNIDDDPCFADANNGDYHLLEDSPCINAGDPNYIAEPNETDLDGRPRVIGGRIDMGAYEYSPPIPAEVRIVPRTINLTSRGKWITSLFWLPEDYDVADIDPNSVLLEGEIEPELFWVDEQQQVVIVRFSRSDVQGILNTGQVELTITGQLTDGTRFEGGDTIRVIDKGKKLNQPPNVTITKPQDGVVFGASETIEIEANAWDIDGFVVKVEFFADESKIGEDNDGTDGWKTNWSNHPAGSYSLTAKATDNDGAATTSLAVGITVVEIPLPGQASNPNPADGATRVSPYANLSWTAGSDAVSHDVYLGTTSPGAFRGNQTATTFDPGRMASYTTYYWRIDEVNAGGTTTGTVWSFTTSGMR